MENHNKESFISDCFCDIDIFNVLLSCHISKSLNGVTKDIFLEDAVDWFGLF